MCNCFQTASFECLEQAGNFKLASSFGLGVLSVHLEIVAASLHAEEKLVCF